MKLKKARIRVSDVHHGKVVYVASPSYGIEKVLFLGKPFMVNLGYKPGRPSCTPFVKYNSVPINHEGSVKPYVKRDLHTKQDVPDFLRTRSLKDMNIIPNHYNDWRTFTKLKYAVQYVTKNIPLYRNKQPVIPDVEVRVPIRITNGTYSVNCGAFTNLDGTIAVGDKVTIIGSRK